MASGLRPETEQAGSEGAGGHTLVVLGDSIVFGYGVSYEQSYPARLERLLSSSATGSGSWRVINAGVAGDTVVKGCARFARDVRRYRPDVLLVAFGLNDASLHRTRWDVQQESGWWLSHWRVTRVSRRFWLAAERVRSRLCVSPASAERSPIARPRVGTTTFVAAMGELACRARRDGAKVFMVSLTPVSECLPASQQAAYARYAGLVRHVAERQGVGLVDLRAATVPFCAETMLSPDGVHLTPAGHEWLAAQVHIHLHEAMTL